MIWSECIYEYDGSFSGLLCCIFDSYTRKERPVSILETGREQISLYASHAVETDTGHAKRIWESVRIRSAAAAKLIRRAHLTCLPEREMRIYRLVCRLYREDPAFLKNPTDPDLYPLHIAVRHMGTELEKLRGFVRFSEFDGLYAAEIAPKNRVLPALRRHFCERFADQDFLIYDRTHKEALVHCRGRWIITPLDSFTMAKPGRSEAAFRRLWKTFYDAIAIRERTNPRCQRGNLPLRYRSDMTEFQDESYFQAEGELPPLARNAPSLPRTD